MSHVKKLVDIEANDLAKQLERVSSGIEQIIKLREYREQATGIERVELDRLVELCEGYLDDINILFKAVEYLTQERIEGKLYLDNNGQWRLEGVDIDLRERYPMELLLEEHGEATWQIGRVFRDHISNLYYFLGEGSRRYPLQPGLLVAVRRESIAQAAQSTCQGHLHIDSLLAGR